MEARGRPPTPSERSVYPDDHSRRAGGAPCPRQPRGLRPAVSAGAVAVLLGLEAWFGGGVDHADMGGAGERAAQSNDAVSRGAR